LNFIDKYLYEKVRQDWKNLDDTCGVDFEEWLRGNEETTALFEIFNKKRSKALGKFENWWFSLEVLVDYLYIPLLLILMVFIINTSGSYLEGSLILAGSFVIWIVSYIFIVIYINIARNNIFTKERALTKSKQIHRNMGYDIQQDQELKHSLPDQMQQLLNKKSLSCLEQTIEKIKLTTLIAKLKRGEGIKLVLYLSVPIFILLLALSIVSSFLNLTDPVDLTYIVSLFLGVLAMGILALPNTEYRNLRVQQANLRKDVLYYADLAEYFCDSLASDELEHYKRIIRSKPYRL
jgi:hypothetical protein